MNLASEKQPLASEIITDLQKENEQLKVELQDARHHRSMSSKYHGH